MKEFPGKLGIIAGINSTMAPLMRWVVIFPWAVSNADDPMPCDVAASSTEINHYGDALVTP